MKIATIVAYAAIRNGYSPEKINQILLHNPALVKIRQRSGNAAAQNYLKIVLRFVDYQMRSHYPTQQFNKQQSPQKSGLQL